MLLFVISLQIQAKEAQKEAFSKFVNRFSFTTPHVEANGVNDFFQLLGEYVNKTRSKLDHTQLGYKSTESYGAIVSKNTFVLREFEIDFAFSLKDIAKGGNGAGFGFWLTSQIYNEPRFYGRNTNFEGFGVVIDIENTPFVKFVDSSKTKRNGVPIKYLAEDMYRIKFARRSGSWTITFIQNGKEHVLYTGLISMPQDSYLGITSYSGSSTATLTVEKIISYSFAHSAKKVFLKGERGGRSIYIIILGAAAILGLAYYLYQKKPKEFNLKK